MNPRRFLRTISSGAELVQRLLPLSNSEKGRIFEVATKLFLQTQAPHASILKDVWLLDEVPAEVRRELRLPGRDEGIDLIARTHQGEYWAIQVKYRSEYDQPLTRREIATFTSLASNTCQNIALAVVVHTCTKPIGKRDLLRNTVEIGLDRWREADWNLIVQRLKGKAARLKPRHPYRYQAPAIAAAEKNFIKEKERRGRIIMPCGTGKSLIAYWICEKLEAETVAVLVPSLSLIRQGVGDWAREFLAKKKTPQWICVCSDETVGQLKKKKCGDETDEFVSDAYETGLPTHTEPEEIASRLRRKGPKVVFATYQSGDKLAEAARLAKVKFDLVIFDEAHRTTGPRYKKFAALLRDNEFAAKRRLFMTATERRVNGDADVYSMDDNEGDYGKRFFTMSYKEAIDCGAITDYEILTVLINDVRVRRLVATNRLLNLHRDLTEAEARTVATGIALKRAMRKYKIKKALSFHSSISGADDFCKQQDALNCLRPVTIEQNDGWRAQESPG